MLQKIHFLSFWDSYLNVFIFSKKDFFYCIPELLILFFLLISLIFLVLFFAWHSERFVSSVRIKYIVKNITLNSIVKLFKFLCFIFFLYTCLFFSNFKEVFFFNKFLTFDTYFLFSKIFITFIFIVVLLFCFQFILFESVSSLELPILLGFSFFFSLVLLSSADFFLMYLMVEAITFIVCILIATNYSSNFSLEASIKYFIVSSLSSGLIIYGIFWIYAITKSTNFFEYKSFLFYIENIKVFETLIFPVMLIVFGFLVKLGSFPFSLWTPDVYEGSPLFIVFYFIVSLKTVFLLFFIRVLFFVFIDFYIYWSWTLIICAVGSFLFGSFGAYSQKNIKRFFAYTSLNQLGFILLGLGSFSLDLAISASLFFLITYVLNNLLFFSILLCFYSSKSYKPLVLLSDLKGLSYFYPWHVLGLSVALFSFIGLPPLAGFFSKFLILLAACKSNFFFYILLGLLSNGISAFYYIKLLKLVWFDSFTDLRLKSFFFKSFTNYKIFLLVLFTSLFNCFFFIVSDRCLSLLSLISKSCFFPYF